MKFLILIDRMLLSFFEGLANRFQRHTGNDNFFLSACSFVIVITMLNYANYMLLNEGRPAWYIMIMGTVSNLLLFALGVKSSLLVSHITSRNMRNPLEVMPLARVARLWAFGLWMFRLCNELWPGGKGSWPRLVLSTAFVSMLYWASCTAGPQPPSKLQRFLQKFFSAA